jgi:hypothetical protein
MINDYLRGRACIESVRGSWFQGGVLILSFYVDFEILPSFKLFLLFWAFPNSSLPFCLTLPLFVPFAGFYGFPSSKWSSWAFFGFLGLLAVLHGVMDLNFKLCVFVINGLIKGDWETKWSVPWFDCDESLTWQCLNSNPWLFCFVFLLCLFHLENRVCLSRGVQVPGAAWHAATRTVAGVADLV